ncbi:MAG: plastocyanin/azurin family copper-binding protein [Thermoproteota archaeon]|nr:plastocyanin/azurin family copper-binding protein [Thermoproteota archaeon]
MRKNLRGLLPLFIIIGAFLVIGAVLITSGVLPEEKAREFHPLTDVSISSDMKVIKEPTLQENVLIYAINDVAQRGINIAQNDATVKQILNEAKAKEAAVTIAAVQPTVMIDKQSGNAFHSSAGQVIITSNWQTVEGAVYSEPKNPSEIANKRLESHQQIWNVLVDVDKGQVTQIAQQADRVVSDTFTPNVVRADVNMFVPRTVVVDTGSIIRWSNPSNLPHNVVGSFNQTTSSGSDNANSIILNSNSDNNTAVKSQTPSTGNAIDSGFIQPDSSWQYHFDKVGVFNYLCTIHAEEGMRGTVIVVPPSSSSSH